MQYSNKKKYRKSVFFFDKMEMKQIITATVAVILICLVAVPLIDDSTKEVYSITQNTAQKYYATSSGDLSEDLAITLESVSNYKINGESYDLSLNNIVIITDTGDIWVIYANNYNLYQKSDNYAQRSLGIGGSTTFYTDGTYKATTSAGVEYTGTFSNVIYPSNDGDLGYFINSTAYANDASDVIFFSIANASYGAMFAIKYKATGEEVEKIVSPFASGAEVTLTDAAISYNSTDETIADNAINGLTYKVGDTSYTLRAFIAPLEYKTISENDSVIITILNLIPVMLVVALVLGIGYSIARRD